MVFFSCDGCGETMKKAKVDAHAARCHSCASVSCVDCNVSFYGDDYRQHTSCVSEAERYEGSVYKKPSKASKRSPQEAWMDVVRAAAESPQTPLAQRQALQQMATLDNVPRKEKAFANFAANSLGRHQQTSSLVSALWKLLVETRESLKRQEEDEAKEKESDEQKKGHSTDNGVNADSQCETAKSNKDNNDAPTNCETLREERDAKETPAEKRKAKPSKPKMEGGTKRKGDFEEEEEDTPQKPTSKKCRRKKGHDDESSKKRHSSQDQGEKKATTRKEQKRVIRKALKQILRKAPLRQMKFHLLHKKVKRKCLPEIASRKLLRKMVNKSPFQVKGNAGEEEEEEESVCVSLLPTKKE